MSVLWLLLPGSSPFFLAGLIGRVCFPGMPGGDVFRHVQGTEAIVLGMQVLSAYNCISATDQTLRVSMHLSGALRRLHQAMSQESVACIPCVCQSSDG